MLSDLPIFSETVYTVQQEVLSQKIEVFNAATQGALVLRSNSMQGDYSTEASWARISGLVRRRNPYVMTGVTAKDLSMVQDVQVKVGAGTPPVNIPPSMFRWIQKSPAEAGALIGKQLAVDTLADMVNTTLMCVATAMQNDMGTNGVDITGAGTNTLTQAIFNTAQSRMGDAYQDIQCWVMHSKPLFDVYSEALTNAHFLFNFANVAVKRDAFGRIFVITDSPSLVSLHDGFNGGVWQPINSPDALDNINNPSPGNTSYVYASLGLVSGAAVCSTQGDFDDNMSSTNGSENIMRTYQAEWSYSLGVKGYAWDKSNGGHAPNDAALATGTNWDKYVPSNKALPGVLIRSH